MVSFAPVALASGPDLLVESQRRVWDGRFPLDVVRFRRRRFDGAFSPTLQWELWRRGRAAALLPYDPAADQVVLIEQFRLPALAAGVDPVLVETPAGLCDAGEAPEATARRELLEETGLKVARLAPIADMLLSPGASDEHVAVFAGEVRLPQAVGADGLLGYRGLAGEGEDIRIRAWPAERAIAAAFDGSVVNAATLVALLWFAARRDRLRRDWLGA